MVKQEIFLNKYKELERVLREAGLDYKEELEGEGKPNSSEYAIMRQIRNYMSHNDNKDFAVASDKQLALLEKTIKKYKTIEDEVKKHMKKIDSFSIKTGDTCKLALKLCSTRKISIVPVYSIVRNIPKYNVLSLMDIITNAEVKGYSLKVGEIKKASISFGFVKPTDEYISCPPIAFVTEDGTSKTKALGIIIKQEELTK